MVLADPNLSGYAGPAFLWLQTWWFRIEVMYVSMHVTCVCK